MEAQLIGRHIVTDPGICHGKPTFRGTRVLVSDVVEQIADGMAWETVLQEWHGSITREAIAEALQLAVRPAGGRNHAVLLSLDEFNSLQETLYLLSNPANAAHLRESIAEAEAGKVVERELDE